MPEGRIIKALAGFYYVQDGDRVIECRGRGRFRKDKITPLVGDFVEYQSDGDKDGYVLEIHGRKNELVRPPMANIDQALLVFSAKEPDFNTHLLNRFLILVEHNGIEPFIVITKNDLLTSDESVELKNKLQVYQEIGYRVFYVSKNDLKSFEGILSAFAHKVTTVAGQTGVGKSSLLNAILPELLLKTGEISKALGRGKHTTRHVELIPLEGGLVADTPGFSSLEFGELTIQELSACYPEFVLRQDECKFRGCTHTVEPKCSVIEALSEGKIEQQRYDDYLTFVQEIKDRKPRY